MKDKKKGSQQSAIITESLETSDIRPFMACYYSLRDINTTVSTWPEFGQLMSDGQSQILRLWKHVNGFLGMRQYFNAFAV